MPIILVGNVLSNNQSNPKNFRSDILIKKHVKEAEDNKFIIRLFIFIFMNIKNKQTASKITSGLL